jgi:hypothetical protein
MATATIKEFDDIKISTQTIIGISNLNINIEKLFHVFRISPYRVIEKRRGRKRKDEVDPVPEILPTGSIVAVKFGDAIRGVDTKQRKKRCKFFRNALTIVMFVDGKLVNYKISKNGKFQFTGCKDGRHAIECIKHMWSHIHEHDYAIINAKLNEEDVLYTINDNKPMVTVRFLTVMTNIDFNIGFSINREKLDVFVNSNTHYNSLLETSFGYTGVNIKIKVPELIDFPIEHMSFDPVQKTWVHETVMYSDFLRVDPTYSKYGNKNRYNTFLVFHSGNIIMSGFNPKYMADCYRDFGKLLIDNRSRIEEQLTT